MLATVAITTPENYAVCPSCGKALGTKDAAFGKRVKTRQCCSAPCHAKRWIVLHACCEQATRIIGCVCAFAFECPVHGEQHVGSHE
jgi:hypothetical protein